MARRSAARLGIPIRCPNCRGSTLELGEIVKFRKSRISRIESKATGEFKLIHGTNGHCCTCGMLFSIVEREIPVLLTSRCPNCGEEEHVKWKITATTRDDDQKIDFTAVMECGKGGCRWSQAIRKLFSSLRNVRALGFEWAGVKGKLSVETATRS